MKQFCILLFFVGSVCFAQKADSLSIYSGEFKHGKFKTDLEFEIHQTNNQVVIKFNSLTQNAFGIPAGDISLNSDSLSFALQSDFYRYDFSLSPYGADRLKGHLKVDQKDYSFALNKVDINGGFAPKQKDIRIKSQGLFLYGTIYYPEESNGKAIYLLTSSGEQDRSASRAEAILFAKAGYISFHIDKRGTGISDGNWHLASIPELCEDDLQALEFLHQSEKIEYAQIGIKGSSQGATKVPYLLKKQPKLAYGIAVSCPASTLLESDLNYWINRNIEQVGEENIQDASVLQKSVFQYISGDLSKSELEVIIENNREEVWFDKVWIPELDKVEIDKKLNYSPLPYFKNNQSPMLVIEGTMDKVIPASSLSNIKKTIGKSGNRKNKFISLKGADHAMMLKDDSDFPYWSSLHPKYMKSMLKWIRKQ